MSTNRPESIDGDIINDNPIAAHLCLAQELHTFVRAYDALMAWPRIKIGDTDTHAIAAKLRLLTTEIDNV